MQSICNAPLWPVLKADGVTWRMTVDFCALNATTPPVAPFVAKYNEILTAIAAGSRFYSMWERLQPSSRPHVLSYVDDILVHAPTEELAHQVTREVLELLRETGFKASREKAQLNQGWRASDGKPVAHLQLWQHAAVLFQSRTGPTQVTHVKGHQKSNSETAYWNDQADLAAKAAAAESALLPEPAPGFPLHPVTTRARARDQAREPACTLDLAQLQASDPEVASLLAAGGDQTGRLAIKEEEEGVVWAVGADGERHWVAFVEHIRLIDEDALKLQTKENDDLFVWLRFQARRGMAEAQQAVSRMLFWGQQGISSNLKEAVKFYEKGAARLKDPTLMYDYGVVLLKGQGVKQDIPKALDLLNQAAAQGFLPALTALGWYYQVFENDYRRAVEFWEKADEMGDPVAPSNLGAFYAYGQYPGKDRDEVAAYHYFLKSASRGHTDGAVQLAAYFSRGIPGAVSRVPLNAVLWTKWVSEQNGFLGSVLRKSLDAYLQKSWPASLLYYLLAAEAGFEVAQFNLGFLCDQDPDGLVSRYMQVSCPWRYYNLSTFSEQPAAYALLRMGDLFYGRHPRKERRDVQAAVQMYTAAALQQEPQGLYNLGLLVEEGVSIPKAALQKLGLSSSAPADPYTLLVELYGRCRDHQEEHSFVPCSLALFSVHLKYIWMFHGSIVKFSGVAVVAVMTGLGLLTVLRRLQSRNPVLPDSV
ncbi:protein sel-1 homolog 3-like [Eublepharis macularius]|uniref:Protein sel-1 homolog 3-like n=1 Tax=Eublepharis macularius TaxID=481883 RepID=A0AA97J387_EUBMA|nr:protein sel-1 homolog 3-like [Eublepharis macularius]